jgi:hypothetical protein
MHLRTLYTLLVILVISSSAFAQKWMPPAPLVPNESLKGIAKVAYSDSLKSVVIEYNPDLALKVGPFVTAYHQAHEYGHFLRGHVSKGKLKKEPSLQMSQVNTIMEVGADIYAIETLYAQDKSILLAMLDYLRKSDTEDLTNLAKLERIKHLEYRIAQLDAESNNNHKVACHHLAHQYDSWPCVHILPDGKAQHSEDRGICTHIAHPQGDNFIPATNSK